MTLEVDPVLPNAPVALAGATIYSGRVVIKRPGVAMVKKGEPAAPFGFFVPGVPPLEADGPMPTAVIPEAWLMLCRAANTGNVIGIEHLIADYQADPRGGTARWLALSGTAHAGFPITVGYRVVVAD